MNQTTVHVKLNATTHATIVRWTPSEIAELGIEDHIKPGYNPEKSPHIDAETYHSLIATEKEKYVAMLDRLIAESLRTVEFFKANPQYDTEDDRIT
ncbi:hypothetical protein BJ508DRAFT_333639 [Ascobolus immersus RN42]|uniref:Uncharacterized protein n=1 Tax=Ascobolus immersus RN42 TaxID=1160509 RepID=A0A3N4HJ06_ASCIM|nr:hypothetical protein BJ508DRAFT_333639 [Ascobolus immersus RN42]